MEKPIANPNPDQAEKTIDKGADTVLFANTYLTTPEILKIYTKHILAHRLQKQFWLLVIIFALLLIPCLIKQDYIALSLVGGCLLISILITILAPKFMYRQLIKAQQRLHNGRVQKTLVKFGARINLKEGHCDLTIDYPQITEIYFLPQIYVLMAGKANGVLLKNDCFTKGTPAEFRDFIIKQCPTARLYQRS